MLITPKDTKTRNKTNTSIKTFFLYAWTFVLYIAQLTISIDLFTLLLRVHNLLCSSNVFPRTLAVRRILVL